MHCQECSRWVPDQARYCQSCGKEQTTRAEFRPEFVFGRKKESLAAPLLVLASLLGFLIILFSFEKGRKVEPNPSAAAAPTRTAASSSVQTASTPMPADQSLAAPTAQAEPAPTPTAFPRRMTMVSGDFHLNAGDSQYQAFFLPAECEIRGQFQGKQHELRVLITDSGGLADVLHKPRFTAEYDSSYVPTGVKGTIDLLLPAGTHYIVFFNQNETAIDNDITVRLERVCR